MLACCGFFQQGPEPVKAVDGVADLLLDAPGITHADEDAEGVISAAVKQVLSALPERARLREVKPDLVSLADVAARLSVSRQALQKRDMPPPSLGGLYCASEMLPALEAHPGKVRDALEALNRAGFAGGWLM